jgi:hypothetical protein
MRTHRPVHEQLHVGVPVDAVRELRALAAAAERPLAGEVRIALREHIARHRRAEPTPEQRSAA